MVDARVYRRDRNLILGHKMEDANCLAMAKVLDHGFVRLIDVMGDDARIVQAARVSYGKGTKSVHEDRGLIRYLMRKLHTSPFEQVEFVFHCKMPIFVARQWVRHRTACLAGDTELVFSRPADGKAYRLTVREVFERFQPTQNTARPDKQRNPHFKRERVQAMQLRCMNEETGEVLHTNVVDIWESGVKQLYSVTIQTNHGERTIRASADHLFFTTEGWKKLSELYEREDPVNPSSPTSSVWTISSRHGLPAPSLNAINEELEEWAPIVGWEDYYEISTQGRVRRVVGGQGARSHGRCKKITVSNGRAVTSLNRPGEQIVIHIQREMLRTFVGEPEEGQEACHIDGNSLNNVIENLRWGSSAENGVDMVEHGTSTFLCSQPCEVLSIRHGGMEMTYDLEVSGPWHNFSANDFVVHNSVNEYSGRYSQMKEEFHIPGKFRLQSAQNKQGSDGLLDDIQNEAFTLALQKLYREGYALYERMLEEGVAKEQAREHLPLALYTEWYWKIDLHNLFHFLRLRLDSHAQYEIRVYGEAMAEMVRPRVPMAWEAFEDYRLHSVLLSRMEREALASVLSPEILEAYRTTLTEKGLGTREINEAMAKFPEIGARKHESNS